MAADEGRGAQPRQFTRNAFPDTSASAGDDSHPSVESLHEVLTFQDGPLSI
jgi:hypothetical protein